MEFNFELRAVAVATSSGIVPEMESIDQPNRECDLLESRTTASVRGATIHCTDNAERSCSSKKARENGSEHRFWSRVRSAAKRECEP